MIHYIYENNDLEELIKRKFTSNLAAVDVESKTFNGDKIDYQKDKIRLIQTKIIGDEDVFVIDRNYVAQELIIQYLQRLKKETTVIGHNFNYDGAMFLTNFNFLFVDIHDTMAMAKLLFYPLQLKKGEPEDFARSKISVSLKSLCMHILNIKVDKEEQKSDWGRPVLTEKQITYAGKDPYLTEMLFLALMEMMENSTVKRSYEIERRDIHVTCLCNACGLPTNQSVFQQLLTEHEEKIKVPMAIMNKHLVNEDDLFGAPPINIDSSDQIIAALARIGINVPSTGAEVLEAIVNKHEVIPAIIEYQSLQTKISTHILPYIHLKDEEDNIYPNINQFGTITGRKSSGRGDSSTAINIMGMPKEALFREGIVSKPGYTLVMADYSAIEARICASICNCTNMIALYNKSKEIQANPDAYDEYDKKMADVHWFVASNLLNKLVMNIKKPEREYLKNITYLLVYGGTIKKIIETVAIKSGITLSQEEAKEYRDKWFKLFPQFKDWHDSIIRVYGKPPERREQNTITTMTGKKLRFDSTKPWIVNEVLNYQVQSVVADGIKYAESEISKFFLSKEWGTENDKNVRILLQMHDELILQVPDEHVEECKVMLQQKMETCMQHVTGNKIAIEANVKESKHWEK